MMKLPRTSRPVVVTILLISCLLIVPLAANAQGSPSRSKGKKAEPIEWNHVFPLFGKKLAAKGFKLPLPYGLNLNYMYMKQDIEISSTKLKFGDREWVDVSDLLVFDTTEAVVHSGIFRFDVWVFPFLNVYGLAGLGQSNTSVSLAEPIQIESSPKQLGQTYGVGTTAAFGIRSFFVTADVNFTWSHLELLNDPVFGFVFSPRLGKNFHFQNGMELAIWLGAMRQHFDSGTKGSISLRDAITGGEEITREDVENTDWYQGTTPGQKFIVDRVLDYMENNVGADNELGYNIEKAPASAWNMLAGAQWGINDNWYIRAEGGFIKRYSFLFNLNYRFGLNLLAKKNKRTAAEPHPAQAAE